MALAFGVARHKASLYEVGLVRTLGGLCWVTLRPSICRAVLDCLELVLVPMVLLGMVLLMERGRAPLGDSLCSLARMVLQMECGRVPLGESLDRMVLQMECGRVPLGDSLGSPARMVLQMDRGMVPL